MRSRKCNSCCLLLVHFYGLCNIVLGLEEFIIGDNITEYIREGYIQSKESLTSGDGPVYSHLFPLKSHQMLYIISEILSINFRAGGVIVAANNDTCGKSKEHVNAKCECVVMGASSAGESACYLSCTEGTGSCHLQLNLTGPANMRIGHYIYGDHHGDGVRMYFQGNVLSNIGLKLINFTSAISYPQQLFLFLLCPISLTGSG